MTVPDGSAGHRMQPFAFIHDLRWSEIPDTARDAALNCLIDTLGVGLAYKY